LLNQLIKLKKNIKWLDERSKKILDKIADNPQGLGFNELHKIQAVCSKNTLRKTLNELKERELIHIKRSGKQKKIIYPVKEISFYVNLKTPADKFLKSFDLFLLELKKMYKCKMINEEKTIGLIFTFEKSIFAGLLPDIIKLSVYERNSSLKFLIWNVFFELLEKVSESIHKHFGKEKKINDVFDYYVKEFCKRLKSEEVETSQELREYGLNIINSEDK